jgi:hypothetical protein
MYGYYISLFSIKFMTVNQRVSGSSPEGGALIIKGLQKCSPFLFYEYVTFTSQISNKMTFNNLT